MIEQFHFLRPGWLLALIPLVIASLLLLRHKLFSRNWQAVIDPQLLPHVLTGTAGKASRWPVMLFFLCGLLGIVAAAGPVWQQLPQPVYKARSALVIALDLSRSMNANDIKPSRLARAHFKINDILQLRQEGETAVIAYAAEAFTVIPLTDDTDTITNIVPSLTTDIMPAQGSRADRALARADELLRNAGIAKGHILLITDGIEADQLGAFADIASRGHAVSVLAIGTEAGSPIGLDGGGFLQDPGGNIVIAKTDTALLRRAASTGNGRFSHLSTDDADIQHILELVHADIRDERGDQTDLASDVWQEQGPWLLLLAAPLAALAFRRGILLSCLIILLMPLPQPAQALSWDGLWKNADQQAAEKLRNNQAAQAAELFSDKQWKAAAHYKAQQYEHTLTELDGINTADAHYNRGNALAKLGRYQDALQAYAQALDIQPDLEDARVNKKLIEDLLQQQQQNTEASREHQQRDQEPQQPEQNPQAPSSQDQPASDSSTHQPPSTQPDSAQQHAQASSDAGEQTPSTAQDPAQQSTARDSQQKTHTAEAQADTRRTESGQASTPAVASDDQTHDLTQQATEQWLRKIPDDPGGLLRRKFQYQYRNMQSSEDETKPW